MEHGAGKASKIPPTERYDFVAKDFGELAQQLGT
jgi:hypothetical protein